MDATEVRVRRPIAGRLGRDRFVSGKARLNAMKALVICDSVGTLLFCGEIRPGSMHDITQARTAGLVDLLLHTPLGVQVLADAGYQGLGTDTNGVVITPKPKPQKRRTSLPPSVVAAHDAARKRHSSQRIRVEHVIGHTSRTGASWAATTADANTSTPPSVPSPAYCPTTNTPTETKTHPGDPGHYQPPHIHDKELCSTISNPARGR